MVRPFCVAKNQGLIAKTLMLNFVPNYEVDAVMRANVFHMIRSDIKIRRYEKDIGGPSVVELFDNFPPSFPQGPFRRRYHGDIFVSVKHFIAWNNKIDSVLTIYSLIGEPYKV